MDKINKIEWFGFTEDMEVKTFQSLENALEGQPWLIFKEMNGTWRNPPYWNPAYDIEIYKNNGEQIIEILLGKSKLKKLSISCSGNYNRDKISFVVVFPDGNEETKNFGAGKEGVLSAVRFLKRNHYDYMTTQITKLSEDNLSLKEAVAAIQTERNSQLNVKDSEINILKSEIDNKNEKIDKISLELSSLKDRITELEEKSTNTITVVEPNNFLKVNSNEIEIDAISKLEGLHGLKSVKDEVKKLVNVAKIRQLRKERGLDITPQTLHAVFSGNPGTGKTTVARILANIYKEIGLLSKGHLVEVDRSIIVEKFVGHTAKKMQEIVKSALGGILFIDEAYALAKPDVSNDFGQEAIDTLVKLMEDHRDDLVVVVAGYSKNMATFLDSNLGLKSRFSYHIDFEDYEDDELMTIFCKMYSSKGYSMSDDLYLPIKDLIIFLKNKDVSAFGNARGVRNLFEKIEINQMSRLGKESYVTNEDLTTIILDDIPKIQPANA